MTLRRAASIGAALAALGAAVLLASSAQAQTFTLDLGGGPTATSRIVQLVLLITVLSLAPSILVMTTSFTCFSATRVLKALYGISSCAWSGNIRNMAMNTRSIRR